MDFFNFGLSNDRTVATAHNEFIREMMNEQRVVFNTNFGYNIADWQSRITCRTFLPEGTDLDVTATIFNGSSGQNVISRQNNRNAKYSIEIWSAQTQKRYCTENLLPQVIDQLENYYREYDLQMEQLKALEMLLMLNAQHTLRIYFIKEHNTLIIYTTQMSEAFVRRLVAALPKIFSIPIDPFQLNLLKAYADELDANRWWVLMQQWLRMYDDPKARIKKTLEKVSTRLLNKKLTTLDGLVNQSMRDIVVLENDLRGQYEELLRRQKQRMLYDPDIVNQEFNDFIEIASQSPYLKSCAAYNDETLLINVVTPLSYYDLDYYKLINNKGLLQADLQHAFNKIFIENKYELWTQTVFCLNLEKGYISPTSRNAAPPTNLSAYQLPDYIPHPHIMRYKCWGNNQGIIDKALVNGHYRAAWTQIIAATMNINFADMTVFRTFQDEASNQYYTRKGCISTADPTIIKSLEELNDETD